MTGTSSGLPYLTRLVLDLIGDEAVYAALSEPGGRRVRAAVIDAAGARGISVHPSRSELARALAAIGRASRETVGGER